MALPAAMCCPRCNRLLVPVNRSPRYWGCTSCAGQAADSVSLKGFVSDHVLRWLFEIARSQAPTAQARCPRCRRFMRQAPVPPEAGGAEIDICTPCKVVWFDRDELVSLTSPTLDSKPSGVEWVKGDEPVGSLIAGLAGLPVEEGDRRGWNDAIAWFCIALILIGAVGFRNLEAVVLRYGFIPSLATAQLHRWITPFFVHFDWGHLLGNVYFLWIFGDDVVEFLGFERFIALLLGGTVLGHLLVYVMGSGTNVTVGASGGICAVLAFYAMAFPHAKIALLSRAVVRPFWFRVPVTVAFLAYFLLQAVGFFQGVNGRSSGISFAAHIGGIVAGLVASLMWGGVPTVEEPSSSQIT